MPIAGIPFGTTDWTDVAKTDHPGETGTAISKTRQFGDIRVRMVVYTPATSRITGASEDIVCISLRVNCAPNSRTEDPSP